MKRLFLIIALAVIFAIPTFAQFTTNAAVSRSESELEVLFVFTADTATGTNDSLRSNTFSLEDYDGADYFTVYHDFNCAGTASVCVNLFGSEDNSTFTLLEQIVDTTASETPTWLATNLGNKRAKYYKIDIENLDEALTSSTIKIRGILKDPAVKN